MREHCLTILYLVSICDQALGTIDYSNAMFSTHKNILLHTLMLAIHCKCTNNISNM